MLDKKGFRELALSLMHTEEVIHFDRLGYKITGRRMFASYLEKDNTANIFLSPLEQKVFCEMDTENIYPVPNKWGEKGATTFVLDHVDKNFVSEALLSAYNDVLASKAKAKK